MRKKANYQQEFIIIEEIQQEKQAAFALNVEKMWPVLFLKCGCEVKRFYNLHVVMFVLTCNAKCGTLKVAKGLFET